MTTTNATTTATCATPAVADVDRAVDHDPCRIDDAGVCGSHAQPIYRPGLRRPARACRVCGCTDTDCSGCIERTGAPCFWVPGADDLCSACASRGFHAILAA